jgi:hypothetical protein
MSDENGLPQQFNPRKTALAGIDVLDHGLPALPDVLTRQMSVPVAFWKATNCAVVLFLQYSDHADGNHHPLVMMGTFYLESDRWAAHEYWTGKGWAHDPIAEPGGLRDFDGRVIVEGGGSFTRSPRPKFAAIVVTGRVSPAVTSLALVQNGQEDRRELHSHFGAWVVCTELWSPYEINALDETAAVIGSIAGPPAYVS